MNQSSEDSKLNPISDSIEALGAALHRRDEKIAELEDRIANQEELIAQQEDDYVELLRERDRLSRELRFSKGEARTANALADWYATPEHERGEP